MSRPRRRSPLELVRVEIINPGCGPAFSIRMQTVHGRVFCAAKLQGAAKVIERLHGDVVRPVDNDTVLELMLQLATFHKFEYKS